MQWDCGLEWQPIVEEIAELHASQNSIEEDPGAPKDNEVVIEEKICSLMMEDEENNLELKGEQSLESENDQEAIINQEIGTSSPVEIAEVAMDNTNF